MCRQKKLLMKIIATLQGFKNVYHKEEYGHHKKFYDDYDAKKYHSHYDDFDSHFKAHKGGHHKGGHHKV